MPTFFLTGDILHAGVVTVEADDIHAAITKAEDDNEFEVSDEQRRNMGFVFANHATDEDGNDLDHLFLTSRTAPTWPETDEDKVFFQDWQAEVANGDTLRGFRDWVNRLGKD